MGTFETLKFHVGYNSILSMMGLLNRRNWAIKLLNIKLFNSIDILDNLNVNIFSGKGVIDQCI